MKSCRSSMAHPRLSSAHGPEPLTAPGAAQACPTCLPPPSHQLTWEGDLRHGRPLKKAVRFAPRLSSIGDSTGNRPAFILTLLSTQAPVAMNCGHCSGRGALRSPSAIADAAIHRSSAEFSEMIRPFVPSSSGLSAQLRAQRIGGFICPQVQVPMSSPKRGQLWSVPFPLEKAHLHGNPSPADGLPNHSGKSHIARTFRPYPTTEQTSEYRPAYLFPESSSGFHANTQLDQDRPPTIQNGRNFDTAHGQSHFLLADSKTSAYLTETPLLQVAFNPMNAFWHLGHPDLFNPIRRSHVRQDSDFRWKSRDWKKLGFSSVPSGVRRPSERLAALTKFHL